MNSDTSINFNHFLIPIVRILKLGFRIGILVSQIKQALVTKVVTKGFNSHQWLKAFSQFQKLILQEPYLL